MPGSLAVRKRNAAAAKKRRFEVDAAARRQNQARAGENIGALGTGVASIPRRVVNYIKTSTPSGVAQDVKNVFSSTYEAAKEDPGQFAADAIFSPLAAIRDFGDVRAMARKLRAQGRNAEAEKLEAMAGVSVLSAIPIVGKVAGTAVRDATQTAARSTVKGATRGAVREGVQAAEKAAVRNARPDFSEGFGTFKSGPTKIIWENNQDGSVELVSLRTPSAKRGQGSARNAMREFLAETDEKGLNVSLGASPLDKRTKLNKLVGFYKSLGFEPTGRAINPAGEPALFRKAADNSLAVPVKSKTSTGSSLAVPVKTKADKPRVAAQAKSPEAPNPSRVIADEYSPETARRVRDVVSPDASMDEWRATAERLHGTQANRLYQPENDLAFRDFDLGTYGMRKTIDQPRLIDLDVRRERYLPEVDSNTLYFQDLVNRPYMTGMADRTETAHDITGLGPVDLDIPVREYGGQDYMKYNPFSWGVSTKTMGSNFMNTARRLKREFGVNPLWLPWRMQGSGSDFSKTTGEIMMSHANSTLGRDTRNAMDRFIKDNYIPDFAGIDNPLGYLQFGELAGPQRKAMETALGAQFAQEGGLSQPLARAIITAPDQLNRKAFHLQNVAEIDPDAEVIVKAFNPTYHHNTPGVYKGTLEPGLLESLNVAELIAPTLNAKYADLGDLSAFRGQYAPLSPENFADQMAQYEDLKAAFDARLAAGDTKVKPPRQPVPIGGTNKYMQSVFATGFLDDVAAQALYDKLVASGARIK